MSQVRNSTRAYAHDKHRDRSVAEWVTTGIATLILLAIGGAVLYDWIATPPSPPIVNLVRNGEIREASGQFYVPFTVTNDGGDTVESVQVIAELRIGGEVVQDGEQQIDFLAGGEQEEGAFVFSRDPTQGELILRVASYKLP